MSYLDDYPECVGCPVSKYCGTMVSSLSLCKSHNSDKSEDNKDNNKDKQQ